MLDSACGGLLRERREAGQAVCSQTNGYLSDQVSRWRALLQSLGDWMVELAVMYQEHKVQAHVSNVDEH
jgi:hypothetical protein